MDKELTRCEKLEKSLKIIFGGYYQKEHSMRERFENTIKENNKRSIEEEVFKVFETQE